MNEGLITKITIEIGNYFKKTIGLLGKLYICILKLFT